MALYLIGGIIVVSVVAWVVTDQVRLRRKRGLSREEFVATFRKEGIDDAVPGLVYDHYSSFAVGGRYAVSPDDSYEDVLHEGAEDIDDDAEHLLKRLRLQLPSESARREWSPPLRTVRDMVLWLDWIRRRQESNGPD